MVRIAFIQSRTDSVGVAREQANVTRTIGGRADVIYLSALDDHAWDSPPVLLRDFDAAIFGGSSDFDFHGGRESNDPARVMSHELLYKLENLITYARDNNFPMMGICFGHQLIGHTFGAECVNDKEQSKHGAYTVHQTKEGRNDPIYSQLPVSFIAQYAHKDSLTRLPVGATPLAESDVCRFAALRYGDSMYTFQFHPEVEKFQDPYPHEPSPEASMIIPLWIEEVVKKYAPKA